jgi:hypothetical protein
MECRESMLIVDTPELEFLKATDRAWIMGRGAAACLGWRPRVNAA